MGGAESRERSHLHKEAAARIAAHQSLASGDAETAAYHDQCADMAGLKAQQVRWKRYRRGKVADPYARHPTGLGDQSSTIIPLSSTEASTISRTFMCPPNAMLPQTLSMQSNATYTSNASTYTSTASSGSVPPLTSSSTYYGGQYAHASRQW